MEKRKAESDDGNLPIKKTNVPIKNDVDVVQDDDIRDDIIYLNVGGETMACCRSTLCQVEGSFLASMFSGRWENQKKDRDGNIFLDFDPNYFKLILKFLRSKQLSVPEYPPPAPIPAQDDFPHFYNLVNYLGLRAEFKAKVFEGTQLENEKFEDWPRVSNIRFTGCRRVVQFGYHNEDCLNQNSESMCVTNDTGYDCGLHRWKLQVMSWDVPDSVFIGVIEVDDDKMDMKYMWHDKGVSGWIGKHIIQNGKSKPNESVVCVGVPHILTLDIDAMTLSLANGRDMVNMKLQGVKDPKSDGYYWLLCVGFKAGTKSEVRLLN